ncbi:hypothetical protein [Demequina sp.]|uniref:hypothetical protein n=1 Tax=Demequina sp. TaxID=2050685 RepID=UPI003A8C6D3C
MFAVVFDLRESKKRASESVVVDRVATVSHDADVSRPGSAPAVLALARLTA